MINLDWDKSYEIGINFIDNEHKGILSIMRSIREAINDGDLKECELLSDILIDASARHFAHEEQYLAEVDFPRLEEHKQYHISLLDQARQVKALCGNIEQNGSLEECFDAMEKFLIDDVVMGDLDFKSFLEYYGHSNPPDL